MEGLKKSLFWNLINQFSRFGLSFLALIILARLLTPEDYGIFGILTIFINVADQLSDSGMGGYIIKKKNATDDDYNTLFVYNMVVSLFLYIILFIIAPFVAEFYANTTVCNAIRALGLMIVIQAFSITQRNRLLKELRFKTNALINLSSGLLGLASAIFLAYLGFGVWSLISQQLVMSFIGTLLCVLCTRHIPKLKFKFVVFKEQFSFGVHLLLASLLKAFSKDFVNNIVGKVFSLSITGLYSQASKMQNYPLAMTVGFVDTTFFPVFSKMNDDLSRLKIEAIAVTRGLYALLFPLFGALICFAEQIIEILLGEKWVEMAPIFRILMVASFFMLTRAANRNILKSLGKTAYIFRMELIASIVLFLVLGITIFSHNIQVMALAFVASKFSSAIYTMLKVNKCLAIPISRQIVDFCIYIPLVILPFIFILLLSSKSLIINILIFIICTVGGLLLYDNLGIRDYRLFLRSLLAKKGK